MNSKFGRQKMRVRIRIWVNKNPTSIVLKCRPSSTRSGSDGMVIKTGGKKITHMVISFESLGNSQTALHICFYVNGKPENDPEKF